MATFAFRKEKHQDEAYSKLFTVLIILFFTLSLLQNKLIGTRWPFTLAHAFMATAFILSGKLISPYILKLPIMKRRIRWIILLISLLICALASALNGYIFDGACLFYINQFGNYPLMYIAAVSGTIASFSAVSIIIGTDGEPTVFSSRIRINKLLLFLGSNGVLVFVTNEQIMRMTREVYEQVGLKYNWELFILTVVICIIGVFVLSIPINRFLPVLVGKGLSRSEKT